METNILIETMKYHWEQFSYQIREWVVISKSLDSFKKVILISMQQELY